MGSVTGAIGLAWRYLAYHRVKTAILVTSIALIAYLPLGLNVLVGESAAQLEARARATPLLLGARGSPVDLVLGSLYFETRPPRPTRHAEVSRVSDSGLAEAIPLHLRFRVRDQPIVGTTLEYFSFRGLAVASGRPMAVLGECVLGARAAEILGAGVGDAVVSSPESVFDFGGTYPLRMRVVGVLAPAGTPDDVAVFVDLKTAWVIAGLGHGHADLARADQAGAVLSRSGDSLVANASVVEWNEITPENRASFHFHGDTSEYPVTAILAVPRDARSGVLLRGRYESPDEAMQILRPQDVMAELLGTVLTVRSYAIAAIGLVAAATLATAALVFWLSARLRRPEIETLTKIGASRASVRVLLASEVCFVLLSGATLAAALTLATSRFGSAAIRAFLLS